MKGFYVLLVLVALGGIGWLVYSARTKPSGLGDAAPVPVAAADGFKGYTMGSDSAPVQITEYSDFECPYCQQFATVQMPVVREQLIATGKVLWRYRDFPLSVHKYSRTAALAAQCAGEQGQEKFWEMHDQLFGHHEWAERDKDPTSELRGRPGTRHPGGSVVLRERAALSGAGYVGRLQGGGRQSERAPQALMRRQAIALFALLGLFIALYLWLHALGIVGELTCGTGSCEAVQASRYARFLGVPVALYGVIGYAMLL